LLHATQELSADEKKQFEDLAKAEKEAIAAGGDRLDDAVGVKRKMTEDEMEPEPENADVETEEAKEEEKAESDSSAVETATETEVALVQEAGVEDQEIRQDKDE